jgi:uncharacterized protein (TIGR03000 family)
MFRRTFSLGGTLLLAAALFLTPDPSHAAPRGGFRGGGFHAGGYHHGGYRAGYHNGGYHHHPYYGGWYPYRPYSWGPYSSYPYWYGYYPYYGSSSNSYSEPGSESVYNSGYSSFYYSGAPSSVDGADTRAHITVNLPAGAKLWVNNTPMSSTGPIREFVSPALTPGSQYTYEVKASWSESGREVTQTQTVGVTAGAQVSVQFPIPPETAR